jgi:hypothetical protein
MTRTARNFDELLVLEDNAATAERERIAGVRDGDANFAITVRVHHLNGQRRIIAARKTYSPGSLRSNRNARIQIASTMLSRAAERGGDPVVIAGTSYGSAAAFLRMLCKLDLPFVVQIRPSTAVVLLEKGRQRMPAGELLCRGTWKNVITELLDGMEVECTAAKLGNVALPLGGSKKPRQIFLSPGTPT